MGDDAIAMGVSVVRVDWLALAFSIQLLNTKGNNEAIQKFFRKPVSQRIYCILVDDKCVYFVWENPRDSTVYNVQKPTQLLLTILLRIHNDFERISPKK